MNINPMQSQLDKLHRQELMQQAAKEQFAAQYATEAKRSLLQGARNRLGEILTSTGERLQQIGQAEAPATATTTGTYPTVDPA